MRCEAMPAWRRSSNAIAGAAVAPYHVLNGCAIRLEL
jgi:hypothetical protein